MLAAGALVPALLLAACGDDSVGAADAPSTADAAASEPTATGSASADAPTAADSSGEPFPGPSPEATEVAASAPRLVLTHEHGILVVDALTLEPVEDLPMTGCNRVDPAGDGRHVLVSTTGGFAVLDTGTWARGHGDHDHYFTSAPRLSDVVFPAQEPAHVVTHHGRTVLFDDGTGSVVALDAADVADPSAERRELTTADPHHGVAVELTDGTMLVTEGTEESRSTVRLLDPDGEEITAIDTCPGVHGEAVAAEETVVVGCEDGVAILSGGELTKVDSPDDYGRIGNQAGSEASPVVLGDYKSDLDAELERPTRVALVDTTTASLRLVDLPASYTFRSLGRGDAGEALVLGTDGALHVIDPASGELVRAVPVIQPWEEPMEWQSPRPTLHVHDGTAYVTEPATDRLHAVDVATGEVWASADLGVTPNEVTSASGAAEVGGEQYAGEHEDEAGHEDGAGHEEGGEHQHEHESSADAGA